MDRRESQSVANSWWGWRVLVRGEIAVAVRCVNIRYGACRSLESRSVVLDKLGQFGGCRLLAKHLPGVANVVAGSGSRSGTFADDQTSQRNHVYAQGCS